jgi:hypothetical protein
LIEPAKELFNNAELKKIFYPMIIGYGVVAGAQAWTTRDVKAVKDTAGEWRLRCVPQEFLNMEVCYGKSATS